MLVEIENRWVRWEAAVVVVVAVVAGSRMQLFLDRGESAGGLLGVS